MPQYPLQFPDENRSRTILGSHRADKDLILNDLSAITSLFSRINSPRSVALNLPECSPSRIQFAI